jgi:hypothetical protein
MGNRDLQLPLGELHRKQTSLCIIPPVSCPYSVDLLRFCELPGLDPESDMSSLRLSKHVVHGASSVKPARRFSSRRGSLI